MNIKLRILRFNPETDRKGHWEEYNLEADPDERILDLLHKVKWFDDGSLAFRRSCAHGVCGSCAMNMGVKMALLAPLRMLKLKEILIFIHYLI